MGFLPVHQEATNATARGCKEGDGGISVAGERKTEIQSCKDISETHSAAENKPEYWEDVSGNVGEVREWIRTYRILLMKKITEIKLKFSFLLYSNLKSTDWVMLNLKCYGPGAGDGGTASFHLGCCPFLEKLTTTGVWTGTFLFGIMVLCHLRGAHVSLCRVVQHRMSSSCYCNCNSKLGLKPSELLKGYNCLKEMALFPPGQILDHCSMTSCGF